MAKLYPSHPVAILVAAILLIVPITNIALAAEYFVAPNGIDSDIGTIDKPFASIQRAEKQAEAGDTVWFRGGTYHIADSQITSKEGIYAHVFVLDKSGVESKPIRYWAYQDEKPVFDFTNVKPAGLRVYAFYVSGSWLHFKSLEVIGVQVTLTNHTQSECFENQGSHNIYERLSMHDGMGIGFYLLRGSDNLILNCDAYRNWDNVSEDGRGGNTDGFGCHPRKGGTNNIFRGCRAWFNSDDGYDCINAAESVTFDHCWAFYNGYSTTFASLGDGNGFKAGGYGKTPADRLPNPIPRHTVEFCLSVRNKASGFYANHHVGGANWFNNTAYLNGINFNMLNRLADNTTDIPGQGAVMRNNLGFAGRKELANLDEAKSELSHNYFDMKVQPTRADFMNFDQGELIKARNADGSLPEMGFMHPVKNSPFGDLGAFVEK